MTQLQPDYVNILNTLKEKIRQARIRASVAVNIELLKLYWEIGNTILELQKEEGWGAKIIDKLAIDLKMEFSDFKGLSVRNLKYMRAFAEAYPAFSTIVQPTAAQLQSPDSQNDKIVQGRLAQIENISQNEFVQGMLAQLSWYHHITLLDKVKDTETRLFYIRETVQNGWSRDIMVHQIEGGLHNRKGKVVSNFKNTIAPEQSELVQQLFKDPYKFDFIYLGKEAKERDLEDALTTQITKFLLELGQYFSFMGRQYKLVLGEKEYFFDLLFYHTRLKRYIVIDLKIDDFKPEYKGKMDLYLNLADEYLKQKGDEKSIGLILCKTKDGLVAEYALRDSTKPIGIAEYKIKELLPENIRGELPSIEELEAEIEKEYKELKSPADKKMDRLKELIGGLKQPKVKEASSPKTAEKIFTKVVLPLKNELKEALTEILKEFKEKEIMLWMGSQGFKTDKEAIAHFKEHREFNEFRIEIRLDGFIPAGTKAFYISKEICINTHKYYYDICLSRVQPRIVLLPETLYHQLPDKKELSGIIEKCRESIIDDITQQIERIK